MRNRSTLTLALLLVAGSAVAQLRQSAPQTPPANEPTPLLQSLPQARAATPAPHMLPYALGPGCTGIDSLSSASNLFTLILTESNPIAVDNATNTMLFVHRNNATALGGHSGQLRYDISTNGGSSWTANQGPVNPLSVNGTNGARYPNAAIYNPAANTNPSNAYLVQISPTTAATWNGHVSGVRRLNGTGNTENYNQAGAAQTLIPRGLVKGAPGIFWSIDAVYNGTSITGYRVLKGTWNGSTDVVWAINATLTPTWNTSYDGLPHNSDFNIAFDPTGTYGWICFLGHITPGPANFAYYPVFYKTTDGGTTWSAPIQVDLSQFPCLSSNITVGNTTTTAFDMDLAVDVNGNPHALFPVGNGDNAYAIFFTSWHAMVDLTLDHGVWNPKVIRNVFRGRGTWGTAPNAVSMDMESQVSRSDDGTKLFFLWGDADSLNVNANQQPNLYGAGYNVTTRSWTSTKIFTQCHPVFNGKALFPKAAPTTRTLAGGHHVPVVIGRLLGAAQDPLAVSSFHYVDSVYFADSEFTLPQCTQAVALAGSDSITICGANTLNAGTAQQYLWNTGATTATISTPTSGWYGVAVSNNCCVGWDSVYVTVGTAPVSSFSMGAGGLTRSFTDLSTGSPTSWTWDFGDGGSSTLQNPSHTYAAPGSYTICLTIQNACTTATSCQTLNVTCPSAVPQFTYTSNGLTASFTNTTVGTLTSLMWAFGDGNFSTSANPTHTFAANGSYTVCLAITDACGSDTTCQIVTVGCVLPQAGFNYNAAGLTVSFTNASVGSPLTYLWSFGDGSTSTFGNPQHSYAVDGNYLVCLSVTDTCGTDSICQIVTVCSAPTTAFTHTAGVGGTVGFMDISGGGPTAWIWDFGDGNISTQQNPSNTYASNGFFVVCLTAINACDSATACDTIEVITRIDDALAQSLNLVPNPAQEYLRLIATELEAGDVSIRLENVLGLCLYELRKMHGGGNFEQEIPVENLSEGLYFVRFEIEGRQASKKLILH